MSARLSGLTVCRVSHSLPSGWRPARARCPQGVGRELLLGRDELGVVAGVLPALHEIGDVQGEEVEVAMGVGEPVDTVAQVRTGPSEHVGDSAIRATDAQAGMTDTDLLPRVHIAT